YKLLVAQDVYVHHFGSRTFRGLGVDCARQLGENFERFRQKWGEEAVAGYRRPQARGGGSADGPAAAEHHTGEAAAVPAETAVAPPDAGPPPAGRRPRFTLCMMVKDEQDNLPDCLGPLRDLFDEVLVADTGSTDRTREVAEALGATVIDFPWCDSFAA